MLNNATRTAMARKIPSVFTDFDEEKENMSGKETHSSRWRQSFRSDTRCGPSRAFNALHADRLQRRPQLLNERQSYGSFTDFLWRCLNRRTRFASSGRLFLSTRGGLHFAPSSKHHLTCRKKSRRMCSNMPRGGPPVRDRV